MRLFGRDVWDAMRATPRRRLFGWVVVVALLATTLIPNWALGLLAAVAILIGNQFLANRWADLDALRIDSEHKGPER